MPLMSQMSGRGPITRKPANDENSRVGSAVKPADSSTRTARGAGVSTGLSSGRVNTITSTPNVKTAAGVMKSPITNKVVANGSAPLSSVASSRKLKQDTPLSVYGISSIAERIQSIYDAASEIREDFKNDYKKILDRPVPIKKIEMNYKDHNLLVKNVVVDLKAALADLIQRKQSAAEAVRNIEHELADKFAEAFMLQGKVKELTLSKTHSDDAVARLQTELAETQAALEIAQQNEAAANAEIDEANTILQNMAAEMKARDDRISTMESELADYDAINRGLEDDKEELTTRIKDLTDALELATNESKRQLETFRSSFEEESSSSKSRIEALLQEREQLISGASTSTKRIAELERALNMNEIALAKLESEKSAAIEARDNAAKELERVHASVAAKEATIAATMNNFNRTQELQLSRERELASQLQANQDRIVSLTVERDALRLSDSNLQVDLRESRAREARLTDELEVANATASRLGAELDALRLQHTSLQEELALEKSSAQLAADKAAALREDLEERLAVASGKQTEAEDRLRVLTEGELAWRLKSTQWTEERLMLTAEKTKAEDQAAALAKEIETLREAHGASEESKEEKLVAANREVLSLKRRLRELAALNGSLHEAEQRNKRLQESLFASEMQRRKLHNQVQELKGNIRVYVRVRPLMASDGVDSASSPLSVSPDETSIELLQPAAPSSKDVPGQTRKELRLAKFQFDHIFGPRAGQEDVFNEVSHLVQSALDGYNVCLFSYGQTGSGKTHTMQGGEGNQAGLIPRSVKKILDTIEELAAQGWEYSIEASFLEIYNETLRDLLRTTKAASEAALIVHQDPEGRIDVPGLTRVPVDSAEAVDALMARAARKRAVAATAMNAQSSRSHSVFTLYVRGRHAGKGVCVSGSLNLCDLAGSERLSKSGAEGDRKKETAAINKSLSCLADVFTALARRAPHVPFRNSKLTQLLQNCFRGDGKTLMLANLSPTPQSAGESLCSLRFAAQVSQVEMGKPKKRIVEADDAANTAAAPAAMPVMPISAPSHAQTHNDSLRLEDLDDAQETELDFHHSRNALPEDSFHEELEDEQHFDDTLNDSLEEETDMHGLDTSYLSANGNGKISAKKGLTPAKAVAPPAVPSTATGAKRPFNGSRSALNDPAPTKARQVAPFKGTASEVGTSRSVSTARGVALPAKDLKKPRFM